MQKVFKLTINRPLSEVWSRFSNPDLLPHWQPNLKSYQFKSGTPGQAGAVSHIHFKEFGQEIQLEETILEIIPMSKFAAKYQSRLTKNVMHHDFQELDLNQTIWTVQVHFEWHGLAGRMIGAVAGPAIEKRFSHDFQLFKELVEKLG